MIDVDVREDTRLVGQDYPSIGYSISCPRCGNKNTAYSSLHEDWWCMTGCGLIFTMEEGRLFQAIDNYNKEDYYEGY